MRKTNPKSYEYIENLLAAESDIMQKARQKSAELQLETISISLTEASLIQFFLRGLEAKLALEIGTLTGLSALYLLKALHPEGKLITIEKSEKHAALAAQVLAEDIKKNRCEIIVGDAIEKLKQLESLQFDVIFIDGNKAAYLDYFNWSFEHIRIGGLIIVDNVFLAGAVWEDETQQRFNAKQIDAVRSMNQKAFSETSLASVIVPTAEGLLISRRIS